MFDSDQNNWCNLSKYRGSGYGTSSNPTLPGCTYYKNKTTHTRTPPGRSVSANPDLLEGIEISIDDVSGISEIVVEIGKCSGTYSFATDVASVVASTTSANGVKSGFRGIRLYYNQLSTSNGGAPGSGMPSLLTKLANGGSLDDCLVEGKNYVKVTAKDNARSNSDGKTLSANSSEYNGGGSGLFVKIDNALPKLGISGDASKAADLGNAPSSCFVGGMTDEPAEKEWKNYAVSGNIATTDPFGADVSTDSCSKCTVFSGATYTCTTSAPKGGGLPASGNAEWISPAGINPTTGKFTGYTCDGLGPMPNTDSCDWTCKNGLVWNGLTGSAAKCVQGGTLAILFDPGTPEAAGPNAWRFDDRATLVTKQTNCTTPAKATSSVKYAQFKYSPTGNYNSFPSSPTGPFPIVENGSTLCLPTCWTNYVPTPGTTGGTCTARVQNPICPIPPALDLRNTVWNTLSYGTQTWAGTSATSGSWSPSTLTTSYDTTAGTCRYKCAPGATWNATDKRCELPMDNCPSGDYSGSPYDGACGTAPVATCSAQKSSETVVHFNGAVAGGSLWDPIITESIWSQMDSAFSAFPACQGSNMEKCKVFFLSLYSQFYGTSNMGPIVSGNKGVYDTYLLTAALLSADEVEWPAYSKDGTSITGTGTFEVVAANSACREKSGEIVRRYKKIAGTVGLGDRKVMVTHGIQIELPTAFYTSAPSGSCDVTDAIEEGGYWHGPGVWAKFHNGESGSSRVEIGFAIRDIEMTPLETQPLSFSPSLQQGARSSESYFRLPNRAFSLSGASAWYLQFDRSYASSDGSVSVGQGLVCFGPLDSPLNCYWSPETPPVSTGLAPSDSSGFKLCQKEG